MDLDSFGEFYAKDGPLQPQYGSTSLTPPSDAAHFGSFRTESVAAEYLRALTREPVTAAPFLISHFLLLSSFDQCGSHIAATFAFTSTVWNEQKRL